jgi:hypothetical protein
VDAILAAETESDRWRRILVEKVETIIQLRALPRLEAEREGFEHLMVEYLDSTHPNTDPTRCGHCGDPEPSAATLLPVGWGERHAWLHQRCWVPWRERRVLCVKFSKRRSWVGWSKRLGGCGFFCAP